MYVSSALLSRVVAPVEFSILPLAWWMACLSDAMANRVGIQMTKTNPALAYANLRHAVRVRRVLESRPQAFQNLEQAFINLDLAESWAIAIGDAHRCGARIDIDRYWEIRQARGDVECAHCWHLAPVRHAVLVEGGQHIDEICCHCGETRCRTVMFPMDRLEHGLFAPG